MEEVKRERLRREEEERNARRAAGEAELEEEQRRQMQEEFDARVERAVQERERRRQEAMQGCLRGDGGEPGSWSMTTRWRRGSAGMNRRSFLDEWQRWKIWFKIQTAQCCETQPLLLLFEFRRPGWSERT